MTLLRRTFLGLAAALGLGVLPLHAADVSEIRVDFATYNPVSLVLKKQGILEKEFEKDGISIRWVQSAGSNKALEYLKAGSIDFGASAGAAALIAKVNGNPVKSVFIYAKSEWTALVTRADSDIKSIADLKGKSVAVTRGTDPHVFLVRALADAGLTEKDVNLVLLQHADGKTALLRGDVDAWIGLDPMMAAAELEAGARLVYRNPGYNSWGVLNVREAFASEHPELVRRVLAAYDRARNEALKNPDLVRAALVEVAKLPDPVIARQLERTDLTHSRVGDVQKADTVQSGLALQKAGVIPADADVKATVDALIEPSFAQDIGQ